MIQTFIKTLALFILFPVFHCDPFYTQLSCSNSFDDISGTGTRWHASDDSTTQVSIGFSFNFYGSDYSDVLLGSNGFMSFDLSVGQNCCGADDIPDPQAPNNWILMYQEDMHPNAGNGEVHYETKGAAPNRQFIYQFTNVPEYNNIGANTFQAVLYESSNRIQLRYGPLNAPDVGTHTDPNDVPTIGIENADGSEAIRIDATTVSDGTCIEFSSGPGYDCISDVSECADKPDGNYHSCISCNVFASCWGGGSQLTDNRPCAPVHPWQEPLEYDANLDACVWAGTSTTCNGGSGPSQNCDYNYAFVMDESGSIGETNYQASIDFIIDLIQNHIADTAQLTALAFNGGHDWIYHFSQTQLPRAKLQPGDPDLIIDELITEKGDYNSGGTNTKGAVQAAIAEFQVNGFTDNNILILVTDGMGTSPCESSIINDLDNNNIRVIIVGVGGFDSAPVACLVRGQTADIIDIDNFDFAPVVTQLQQGQVVCDEIPTCYDSDENNPCTQENIDAGNFYFPSCTSCCSFIQCDAWGNAFDMPCAAGTYWDVEITGQNHNMGQCLDAGCTLSPAAGASALQVHINPENNPLIQHIGDQSKNVENTNNYYGFIILIGVIAFILINNVFIGCWCLRKGKNKSVKFEMVGDDEEI